MSPNEFREWILSILTKDLESSVCSCCLDKLRNKAQIAVFMRYLERTMVKVPEGSIASTQPKLTSAT